MAVIWADEFTIYGGDTTKMSDGVYAQVSDAPNAPSLDEDPDPNVTGKVLKLPAKAISAGANPFRGCQVRYALPAGGVATLGVAFRIWFDDLPSYQNNAITFEFVDDDNVCQVGFYIHTSGAISAYRGQPAPTQTGSGGSGTLLGTSSGPVVTAGAWTHLEFKVNIHDSTGTVEVRSNGTSKLSLTGQDTKNTSFSTVSQFLWNNAYSSAAVVTSAYIKDFIVWDTSGSVNNNFLGSVGVIRLDPNADTSFNWTPSSGSTGYNLIDEYLTVDDTDKITAASAAVASSVFALTDLPADVISVKGLVSVVRARKVDSGDANLQVNLITAGDTDSGADRPITSAFTYWYDVSEVSPDTGIAWTPAEVNAATIEVDRTL